MVKYLSMPLHCSSRRPLYESARERRPGAGILPHAHIDARPTDFHQRPAIAVLVRSPHASFHRIRIATQSDQSRRIVVYNMGELMPLENHSNELDDAHHAGLARHFHRGFQQNDKPARVVGYF